MVPYPLIPRKLTLETIVRLGKTVRENRPCCGCWPSDAESRVEPGLYTRLAWCRPGSWDTDTERRAPLRSRAQNYPGTLQPQTRIARAHIFAHTPMIYFYMGSACARARAMASGVISDETDKRLLRHLSLFQERPRSARGRACWILCRCSCGAGSRAADGALKGQVFFFPPFCARCGRIGESHNKGESSRFIVISRGCVESRRNSTRSVAVGELIDWLYSWIGLRWRCLIRWSPWDS